MSNLVLLSDLEAAQAAAQGWSLGHVYDLDTAQWRVQVLGSPSAAACTEAVVGMARMGDPLAQKALSLVMNSNKGK